MTGALSARAAAAQLVLPWATCGCGHAAELLDEPYWRVRRAIAALTLGNAGGKIRGCRIPAERLGEVAAWCAAHKGNLYVWHWKSRLPERRGQPCRLLVRGAMNSVMVEFVEDGWRVITSVYALRRAPTAEPSRAEPSRAEPSRAEPSRAEPSRRESDGSRRRQAPRSAMTDAVVVRPC